MQIAPLGTVVLQAKVTLSPGAMRINGDFVLRRDHATICLLCFARDSVSDMSDDGQRIADSGIAECGTDAGVTQW